MNSLRVLNAFNALMLGLKMLPAYMGETYEEFLGRIHDMPPEDQEKMIREAVHFVQLQRDELEAIMSFAEDSNGVPYCQASLKTIEADTLVNGIVAVCMQIAKMKIDLVSEDEKKK